MLIDFGWLTAAVLNGSRVDFRIFDLCRVFQSRLAAAATQRHRLDAALMSSLFPSANDAPGKMGPVVICIRLKIYVGMQPLQQ